MKGGVIDLSMKESEEFKIIIIILLYLWIMILKKTVGWIYEFTHKREREGVKEMQEKERGGSVRDESFNYVLSW